MTIDTLLAVVGFTEPSDFGEICDGLTRRHALPEGREEWKQFFELMKDAERRGYLLVVYKKSFASGGGNRVETLQLTAPGANYIRPKLDAQRGLLGVIGSQP